MSVRVRGEEAFDAGAIRAVHLAAFPTAAEADLVQRLHRDLDSEISLVAEPSDDPRRRIVGHVMLSRMRVEGGGRTWRALGLGPVAVLPGLQRQGIGALLINTALNQAEANGEELVFLVGDPDYYRRFGFAAETAAPFASPYAGQHFQALQLTDAPLPSSGRADYAPAFAGLG